MDKVASEPIYASALLFQFAYMILMYLHILLL